MVIYFAGSIRGGRTDAETYNKFIQYLKPFGEVLTEHVGDNSLIAEDKSMTDSDIHDRDLNWIKRCSVLVAEVSQPSLGVGYELAMALQFNKRVLCLFNPNRGIRLSAMIKGQKHFTIKNYKSYEEAFEIIDDFLT